MKRSIYTFVPALMFVGLHAQALIRTVTGTVRNAAIHEAFPGVAVKVKGTNRGAAINEQH